MREGGREGGQVTGHSSLSVGGKTEALTETVKKNTRLPLREEGGRGEGDKGHHMPLAVDLPQVPLVNNSIPSCRPAA